MTDTVVITPNYAAQADVAYQTLVGIPLDPARLQQGDALPGNALVWNGTHYAPGAELRVDAPPEGNSSTLVPNTAWVMAAIAAAIISAPVNASPLMTEDGQILLAESGEVLLME